LLGLATLVGQNLDAVLRQHPSGYVQNYSPICNSMSVTMVVEVGYASFFLVRRGTPTSSLRTS
jgi:hypothetical protein